MNPKQKVGVENGTEDGHVQKGNGAGTVFKIIWASCCSCMIGRLFKKSGLRSGKPLRGYLSQKNSKTLSLLFNLENWEAVLVKMQVLSRWVSFVQNLVEEHFLITNSYFFWTVSEIILFLIKILNNKIK